MVAHGRRRAENLRHIARLKHALTVPAATFGNRCVDEIGRALFPYIGDLHQRMGALMKSALRPVREGFLCGTDGRSGFGNAAIGDAGIDRTVGRVDILKAARGCDPFATDIHSLDDRGRTYRIEHDALLSLDCSRPVRTGTIGAI